MQYDYYAFRREELNNSINELNQAIITLDETKRLGNEARKISDKGQREKARQHAEGRKKQAEIQKKQVSRNAVSIEPHLAYLWFWAKKEEAQSLKHGEEARRASEAANSIRDAWQGGLGEITAIPEGFYLVPDASMIANMPPLSFLLQVPFQLKKPYISKDEGDFYLLDNPLRKEKIFRVPMVAATGWKGALRAAMMRDLVARLYHDKNEKAFIDDRLCLYRLFGNEKDGTAEFLDQSLARLRMEQPPESSDERSHQKWRQRLQEEQQRVVNGFEIILREKRYRKGDVEGFKGRLHFYPTFFERIGLAVINPHSRESGVGTRRGPIFMECVPEGRQSLGNLMLLYVPFDPVDREDKTKQSEVAQDLKLLAEGVQAMLTTYGFGAKTSSGFGMAEERLPGVDKLIVKTDLGDVSSEFSALGELPIVARNIAAQLHNGGAI